MFKKIHKGNVLIIIVLMVSLFINIIVIPRMLKYENHINREISHSVDHMLFSIFESQKVLQNIINTKEMDEIQYKSIFYDYEDFEDEFLTLVNYNNKFKIEDINNLNRDVIHSFTDQIYQVGDNNEMSLHKKLRDDIVSIKLTEEELIMFEEINEKSKLILAAVYDEDSHNEFKVNNNDWVKIIVDINKLLN